MAEKFPETFGGDDGEDGTALVYARQWSEGGQIATHHDAVATREVPSALDMYLRGLDEIAVSSTETVRQLAIRSYQGDRMARKQLVESQLRLVVKLAIDHARLGPVPLDELIAIGNDQLAVAATKYDPNHDSGANFTTVAWRYVESAMRHARNHVVWEKLHNVSADAPVGPSEDEHVTLAGLLSDTRPTPDEVTENKDLRSQMLAMLKRLPEQERIVAYLQYGFASDGHGLGPEEIARRVGISRKEVKKCQERAVRTIREWMRQGQYADLIQFRDPSWRP